MQVFVTGGPPDNGSAFSESESDVRLVEFAPARFSYCGPCGAVMGARLREARVDRVLELRLTSHVGDLSETLDVVERYLDDLDLLVVEGICASAAANYIVPAARRLAVEPGGCLVLQGGFDLVETRAQLSRRRQELLDEHPLLDEAYLDSLLSDASTTYETLALRQSAFEKACLLDGAWLRPRHPPVVADEALARRCLKNTRIERFAAPQNSDEILTRLAGPSHSLSGRAERDPTGVANAPSN